MTFLLDALKALILGIVEGITEWLPISSTGHMILVNALLGTGDGFFGSQIFLYVIQLGAILAVATLYFHKLNPFSPKKTALEKRGTWEMWFKVIVACVPAAVIGLLFDDYMDAISTPLTVSITLVLYGIAFILVEKREKTPTITAMNMLSYKTALFIGLFQVLSIVPGTSRSGATILGAILLGCSRKLAAEFSFFLAIPVMFGVSFLKIVTNDYPMAGAEWLLLFLAMLMAYIVSLLTLRMLVNYVKKHSFTAFGWYRIALGAVVLLFFFLTKAKA